MGDPTSTKQYVITGPTVPGDIISGSVTDSDGTQIFYQQVGKLYFGFDAITPVATRNTVGGYSAGHVSDAADRIASMLGSTVNTTYEGNAANGAGNLAYFDTGGGVWAIDSGGTSGIYLYGILIN